MSKKTIITFILLILILGVSGYFIIGNKQGAVGTNEEIGVVRNVINRFFPFGDNTGAQEEGRELQNIPSQNGLLTSTQSNGATLQQITNTPIVGFVAIATDSGLVVRYMDQNVGNMFETNLYIGEETRLTNTTFPAVQEIFWHENGQSYVLRYPNENDVVETYVGTIVPPEVPTVSTTSATSTNTNTISSEFGTLKGSFLDGNIDYVARNASGTGFIYTSKSRTLSYIQSTLFDADQSNDKTLFTSAFGEWLIAMPNESTISMNTKPASIAQGSLYFLDTNTRLSTKIFGNKNGLTTNVRADTEIVLFSESNESSFEMSMFNTLTHRTTNLSINTLPEKCTWGTTSPNIAFCAVPKSIPTGQYPEHWYQGKIRFTDELWEINTDTNIVRMLFAPEATTGVLIDAIDLSVTPDGEFLLFKNKRDSTLWSLTLTQSIIEVEEETTEEINTGDAS